MDTDEKYLQSTLYSLKMELNEIEMQRRIATAEYKVKYDMLNKQIDSIEKQLGDRKNK